MILDSKVRGCLIVSEFQIELYISGWLVYTVHFEFITLQSYYFWFPIKIKHLEITTQSSDFLRLPFRNDKLSSILQFFVILIEVERNYFDTIAWLENTRKRSFKTHYSTLFSQKLEIHDIRWV